MMRLRKHKPQLHFCSISFRVISFFFFLQVLMSITVPASSKILHRCRPNIPGRSLPEPHHFHSLHFAIYAPSDSLALLSLH